MLEKADIQKIEKIRDLLKSLIKYKGPLFLSLRVLKSILVLNNYQSVKRILKIIDTRTSGNISFETKMSSGWYRSPSVANVNGEFEPVDRVPVGFDIHIEDRNKLDEYFGLVLATEAVVNEEKVKSEDVIEKILQGPQIYFDAKVGKGFVNGKSFTFKDGGPEYRIFAMLYKNINKKLLRYPVLVLAHFYEDEEDIDPARKIAETSCITERVRIMRRGTGLTKNELVNNGGNLTLRGRKVESPN